MITITEATVQQINAALLSIQNGNRSTSRNNSSGNNTISLVNEIDSNFAVCNTSASESSKEVTLENLAELEIGVEIKVLFTNGNTVGSCVGTESNKITSSSAPKLKVNNFNAYPIKVGGEYAGENFVRVGDVHSLVFDGESWNDLTADVIYKNEILEGSYVKRRSGLVEQQFHITFNSARTNEGSLSLSISCENLYITVTPTYTNPNTRNSAGIGCYKQSNTAIGWIVYGVASSDRFNGAYITVKGY